jgi:hypothetical protein
MLLLCTQVALGQTTPGIQVSDSSFILTGIYEGDIADAAIDNLDNLYIVSSTGQIKKFNASGDSIGVYNQVKKYGRLFSIDVSNPLKILLFYKDFSTVVVLDRFLANINTIPLRKYSILQPGAIGMSYDDNIWVYDEYDNKLKKLDNQGNKLLETTDFRTVFNQIISPQKIINDNGFVYLADTLAGVFVFDNYGSFKRKIPMINWQSFAVNRNNLISTQNETIIIYNQSTLLETTRKNPFFKPYHHSLTSANKFVSFSNNRLEIYQYKY